MISTKFEKRMSELELEVQSEKEQRRKRRAERKRQKQEAEETMQRRISELEALNSQLQNRLAAIEGHLVLD